VRPVAEYQRARESGRALAVPSPLPHVQPWKAVGAALALGTVTGSQSFPNALFRRPDPKLVAPALMSPTASWGIFVAVTLDDTAEK
jgi:hypothetical protein